jgi:hypothetical protein
MFLFPLIWCDLNRWLFLYRWPEVTLSVDCSFSADLRWAYPLTVPFRPYALTVPCPLTWSDLIRWLFLYRWPKRPYQLTVSFPLIWGDLIRWLSLSADLRWPYPLTAQETDMKWLYPSTAQVVLLKSHGAYIERCLFI